MATKILELLLLERKAKIELLRAAIKGSQIAKQTGHLLPTMYEVLRCLMTMKV